MTVDDDLLHRDVLGQEARGAGVHGVAAEGLVAVHGEDHDRQVGELGVDPPGGLDPVEDRHRHVHHHHVGLELAGQAHGLAAVAGLGHHRHAGVLERPADRLAQELMVVGEEHPHQIAVPS